MKVIILFFGATAETIGERRAEISLEEGIKAEDALQEVFVKFPDLGKYHDKNSLLFAVNQEYATGDEIISPGDELAVFTAVSGG